MARTHRVSASLVIAVLFASALAGCSSDAESGEVAPGADTTTTTTEAPASGVPVTTSPRQACDSATLSAVAAAVLEGASITETVCETEHAVGTWASSPGGETIVLFSLQSGVWTYVANGPTGGEVAALAPEGFSATAIPAWERLRASLAARRSGGGGGGGGGGETGNGSGGGPPSTVYYTDPDTGTLESCTTDGDNITCVPAPPIPPTTVDPENPDATVPPSGFCRFNFNDPRCQADNQYEP